MPCSCERHAAHGDTGHGGCWDSQMAAGSAAACELSGRETTAIVMSRDGDSGRAEPACAAVGGTPGVGVSASSRASPRGCGGNGLEALLWRPCHGAILSGLGRLLEPLNIDPGVATSKMGESGVWPVTSTVA